VQPGDGIVRVRRETGSRGGKTVTAIRGVPVAESALKELAGELKRLCGSGGTAKDGVIEIQGDHRDALAPRGRSELAVRWKGHSADTQLKLAASSTLPLPS
ncbi:MAG TPA: hypothetical protein VFX89_07415, partial [Gammaproteobacteria bacterium]|nr:hypothetical protein [Gammaproteobacteria bacterium]